MRKKSNAFLSGAATAVVLIGWTCFTSTLTEAAQCPPILDRQGQYTADIQSMLNSIVSSSQADAIIFSAEINGKPVVRTALGYSTGRIPATTDMHFRIGAVGWQYLVTILLEMVDQRQIALAAPVSRWFPNYPNAERATVRMLGASSAGFGDYIYGKDFFATVSANPFRQWTADELVRRSLPDFQTFQFKDPGHNWDYSHTGFVMLGEILEQVQSKPYDQLLHEAVLDRLGLGDTRLQLDTNVQTPVLHTLTETEADTGYHDSTFWNPSWVSWAAMTSNICDLGAWNQAFGTGRLLSKESNAEITAPVNVGLGVNTPQIYYGLGTEVRAPWIVQNASYWGMFTTTAYDPTTGVSIEATASLAEGTKADASPSRQIVWAASSILAPGHPIPGRP